jgi:RES domain-containing protein
LTFPVYRLAKKKHRAEAFKGLGGVHADSRWTSRGRPVVYAAGSISLALLEFTVHHRRRDWIPSSVLVKADIPDAASLETVSIKKLPEDWRAAEPPPELRRIGDDWLERGETLLLRVPSAIVPEECNFLINPSHPEFHQVLVRPPTDYIIDGRLIRTS